MGQPISRDHTTESSSDIALERGFRHLLEKLPAGAYTCDADGLITYYNQRAVDLWGRAPKLNDPVDRFCGSFRLFSIDGTPIRHDECWMALALHTNAEYNGQEIIVERPDGSRLTALAHANPVCDDSGKLVGAVNVLVDVTELKNTQEALEEAHRSKDEFLATLAHELRNPLAPVRNAVELLQHRAALSEEWAWALGVIDRQMQQMTRLIDDLLDVSRITRNKLRLQIERVKLEDVVKRAVETSRPLIEERGHELSVSVPAQPVYLDADATRLAQSFSNLLNNAAKYTQQGGHIWLVAERQGSDAVITVRDTGVGIPMAMLPRIFDMFTQVDRSLERSEGGLGIGLSLVKRLVEMHGGTIEAHSDGLGKGSEFRVRLPVVIESSIARNSAQVGSRGAKPSSTLRILIVDDNRDSAATLSVLLRSMGNEIRIAHDGVEAVGVADEFRPHIAILDIGLPKMNGYDAARRIRQQSWSTGTVLVAITGWGQEGDRQRSKDAGFDQHMVKPVDPALLMELIASVEQTASCAR